MQESPEKNFVLNGTVEAQPLYTRLAFKGTPYLLDYLNIRQATPLQYHNIPDDLQVQRIASLGDVMAAMAFDRSIRHTDRTEYMCHWLPTEHSTAFAANRGGACVGFASFRASRGVVKVQPLHADDAEAAAAMIRAYLLTCDHPPFLQFTTINWKEYPQISSAESVLKCESEVGSMMSSILFTKCSA